MLLRKKLHSVASTDEKISLLESLTSLTPRDTKNLALRTRYKEELENLRLKKSNKTPHLSSVYEGIRYSRQVVLVGQTNTGKSTLLSNLTNSRPTIKDTPFTTHKPEVGMMTYLDVPIQIVEVPALYDGDAYVEKYRFIRNSDVLCVCTRTKEDLDQTVRQLEDHLIILNVNHVSSGTCKSHPRDTILEKPVIVASWAEIENTDLPVSNIGDTESVMHHIYQMFNIKRVYSLAGVKNTPLLFPADQMVSLSDFIEKLDRRFVKLFTRARISGPSAKYERQIVGLDYLLSDGDKVELIK